MLRIRFASQYYLHILFRIASLPISNYSFRDNIVLSKLSKLMDKRQLPEKNQFDVVILELVCFCLFFVIKSSSYFF